MANISFVKGTQDKYTTDKAKATGAIFFGSSTGFDSRNAGAIYVDGKLVTSNILDASIDASKGELNLKLVDGGTITFNGAGAMSSTIEALEAADTSLSARVSKLEASLGDWKSSAETIAAAVNALEVSTGAQQDSIEDLKLRAADASSSLGNLSEKIDNVSNNLADLSTYVYKTVDASIAALKTEDSSLEAAIKSLQSTKDQFLDKVEVVEADLWGASSGISAPANSEQDEYKALTDEQKETIDILNTIYKTEINNTTSGYVVLIKDVLTYSAEDAEGGEGGTAIPAHFTMYATTTLRFLKFTWMYNTTGDVEKAGDGIEGRDVTYVLAQDLISGSINEDLIDASLKAKINAAYTNASSALAKATSNEEKLEWVTV